jgi:hypothetical protein
MSSVDTFRIHQFVFGAHVGASGATWRSLRWSYLGPCREPKQTNKQTKDKHYDNAHNINKTHTHTHAHASNTVANAFGTSSQVNQPSSQPANQPTSQPVNQVTIDKYTMYTQTAHVHMLIHMCTYCRGPEQTNKRQTKTITSTISTKPTHTHIHTRTHQAQ